MKVAIFDSDCLPLPPTPNKRVFPWGWRMILQILEMCSHASKNMTNFIAFFEPISTLYSSKYSLILSISFWRSSTSTYGRAYPYLPAMKSAKITFFASKWYGPFCSFLLSSPSSAEGTYAGIKLLKSFPNLTASAMNMSLSSFEISRSW